MNELDTVGLAASIIRGLGKGRVEALTDGIFATVMTVLVLGLRVPTVPPNSTLSQELLNIWPSVLSYAMSFVILGVYWVGHHAMFHYVRATNRVFLWINILFLLTVGFIPFSTSLLGSHSGERAAVIVYGSNLILCGLSLYATWWYAASNHRLVDPDLDPHVVSLAKRRILVGPLVYLAAIGFSFLDTRISIILYILTLPFYILPGHIDIHITRSQH